MEIETFKSKIWREKRKYLEQNIQQLKDNHRTRYRCNGNTRKGEIEREEITNIKMA